MNILFVTGQFAKNPYDNTLGGMARAVYKCAKGMKMIGHDVTILAVDSKNKRWKYDGIDVVSICADNSHENADVMLLIINTFIREIRIEKTIQKLDKEKKIDIIQYSGWFAVGMLHLIHRIPAVMRISTYSYVQLNGRYSKSKEQVLRTMEKIAIRNMNYVFTPGREMAKQISDDVNRKIGVMITPYYERAVIENDDVYKKNLYSKKYFLFFGRISKDKGIYIINEILESVLKYDESLYFVFVGYCESEIRQDILKSSGSCSNRVIFIKEQPIESLKTIIAHSEAVIIPSIIDNLPNSCPESMALGKIVIGSTKSSLEQYIIHSQNGILFKNSDSNDLLRSMIYVINMPSDKKEMMEREARRITCKLDILRYSKRMQKLYETIIKMQARG